MSDKLVFLSVEANERKERFFNPLKADARKLRKTIDPSDENGRILIEAVDDFLERVDRCIAKMTLQEKLSIEEAEKESLSLEKFKALNKNYLREMYGGDEFTNGGTGDVYNCIFPIALEKGYKISNSSPEFGSS